MLCSKGAGKQGNIPPEHTAVAQGRREPSSGSGTLSPRGRGTPRFPGKGACASSGYHTPRGRGTVFPKNTCSLVNPGSAYLRGLTRQLAYLPRK